MWIWIWSFVSLIISLNFITGIQESSRLFALWVGPLGHNLREEVTTHGTILPVSIISLILLGTVPGERFLLTYYCVTWNLNYRCLCSLLTNHDSGSHGVPKPRWTNNIIWYYCSMSMLSSSLQYHSCYVIKDWLLWQRVIDSKIFHTKHCALSAMLKYIYFDYWFECWFSSIFFRRELQHFL